MNAILVSRVQLTLPYYIYLWSAAECHKIHIHHYIVRTERRIFFNLSLSLKGIEDKEGRNRCQEIVLYSVVMFTEMSHFNNAKVYPVYNLIFILYNLVRKKLKTNAVVKFIVKRRARVSQ